MMQSPNAAGCDLQQLACRQSQVHVQLRLPDMLIWPYGLSLGMQPHADTCSCAAVLVLGSKGRSFWHAANHWSHSTGHWVRHHSSVPVFLMKGERLASAGIGQNTQRMQSGGAYYNTCPCGVYGCGGCGYGGYGYGGYGYGYGYGLGGYGVLDAALLGAFIL